MDGKSVSLLVQLKALFLVRTSADTQLSFQYIEKCVEQGPWAIIVKMLRKLPRYLINVGLSFRRQTKQEVGMQMCL